MAKAMLFLIATVSLFCLLWPGALAVSCYDSREYHNDGYTSYCFYDCCGDTCCEYWRTKTYLTAWAITGIVIGCILIVSITIAVIRQCCVSKSKPGRVIHDIPRTNVNVIATSSLQQQQIPSQQQQIPLTQQQYPYQQDQYQTGVMAMPPPAYYKDPPPAY